MTFAGEPKQKIGSRSLLMHVFDQNVMFGKNVGRFKVTKIDLKSLLTNLSWTLVDQTGEIIGRKARF